MKQKDEKPTQLKIMESVSLKQGQEYRTIAATITMQSRNLRTNDDLVASSSIANTNFPEMQYNAGYQGLIFLL